MNGERPTRSRLRRALTASHGPQGSSGALSSNQLTELFVSQLLLGIDAVPSHFAGGLSAERAHNRLAISVGVSVQTTRAVVEALTVLGLVAEKGGVLGRTRAGDRMRRGVRSDGSHVLAAALVRSGVLADQIRRLRQVLVRDGDGYRCGRGAAQAAAPQLSGLLARMPDVSLTGQLVIGKATALELDSVWNEVPPETRTNWSDIDNKRRAVGERAEHYSMQLERSREVGAIDRIVWVSRDDDDLGYDIEVKNVDSHEKPRLVEVKGTSGRAVQFFLSSNECDVAVAAGENYEVQFWGSIDLARAPMDEYEVLRAAGYPITIVNPGQELGQQPWLIEPSQYRVTRPGVPPTPP